MSKPLDIARALQDKDYFASLTPEQQETVRAAGGVGSSELDDEAIESVSGGLEGGIRVLVTSSTAICTQVSAAHKSGQAAIVCIC
ncbi:MAG TPA: hypothetical protein VKY89_03185 [Thermoanaerobaculia bacterium]|jgi:hypothetical protein|nr:hypothetical protein [Thermoanaerobaculia bacterium]